ncbi:Uncharacterised protein [Yersinia enterocolitica]|nr:Uncharacterised protein [Yersinia enterocolitica]
MSWSEGQCPESRNVQWLFHPTRLGHQSHGAIPDSDEQMFHQNRVRRHPW